MINSTVVPLSSAAIPAKSSRVTILKPRSAQIDVEHHLNLYHRIVKVRRTLSFAYLPPLDFLVLQSESDARTDSVRMHSFERARRRGAEDRHAGHRRRRVSLRARRGVEATAKRTALDRSRERRIAEG